MKSGMLAAEAIIDAFATKQLPKQLDQYETLLQQSWLYRELASAKNFSAALHKWGTLLGGAYNFLEQLVPQLNKWFSLPEKQEDYSALKPADKCQPISYRKPDNVLSFDRLSSVYLCNISHDEDQPCHLKLNDQTVPIQVNLKKYSAPEQHYCPAGVYEIIDDPSDGQKLQINAQNCIHCKTCDIKDPSQNILWTPPEGGSGPNYQQM